MDVSRERTASTGKSEKMEALYQYLAGVEFKQKIEGIIEAFTSMQDQLNKERRAMEKVNELKRILQDHKATLKDEYNVIEIGLFGSYTKGNQKKSSDVDILVEFEKTIDLFTFVHLKNHLSDLLGVNVDLVTKKALKPKIGERILSETVYI